MAWTGADPQPLLGQEQSTGRSPGDFLGRISKPTLQSLPVSQGIIPVTYPEV